MSQSIDCSLQQRRFLAAFAASASVIQAARWAKLSRQAHYNWMKDDPTYPERFERVKAQAARTLEDEAVRRAHEGLRREIRYKGRVVGHEIEYSDTLMLALLKANSPEKFRDRSETAITTPDGPITIRVEYEDVPAKTPQATPSTS